MRCAGRKWFFMLSGMTLFFLYACGGGGGGGGSISPSVLLANAGPDQVVYQGNTVTLDGSGSSIPVGTTPSYLWEQLSGIPVDLSDNTAVSPTFTAPEVSSPPASEDLAFRLTVTDGQDLETSDNVTVKVLWGYHDDFSADTRDSYDTEEVYLIPGPLPSPQFNYDSAGKRLQVITEDDVGLKFSKSLPASDNGVFSLDFYPIKTYPDGGGVWVRLMDDQNSGNCREGNCYELAVFEWRDPDNPGDALDIPGLTKYVGGVAVDNVLMNRTSYKSQASPSEYHVIITFSPDNTVVEWATNVQGFSEIVWLDEDPSPINVSKFEIQTNQQDAYYDNITLDAVP
jgi:hypothetical protein